MKLEQGKYCPLIKKDCIGIQCSWFTQIRGTNPNTGEPVDEWGCAVTWMPFLAIEISQKTIQTTASVNSFRNEVAKVNNNQNYLMDSNAQNIIRAHIEQTNSDQNLLGGS